MDNANYQGSGIAQQLYDANSIDDKFSILENEIKCAGFDGLFYSFFPKLSKLSKTLQPVFQFSDSYAPLIKSYQENNYLEDDYIMRLLEEGNLDIIEWWKAKDFTKLSNKEEELSNIIRYEFKITKGITFATLNSDVGLAGASIISFKADSENWNIGENLLGQLKRSIQIYHDHMMINQDDRYKFIYPLLETLTPKKKTVIKYLITGKPMKNISDVGITERYGEKLLLEIRKSFGNISKNELIYLLGLLNITEYL